MNYLDVITEPVLHQVYDEELFAQISKELRAGKVVGRVYYPPDELAAVWDNSSRSPQMGVRIEDENLLMRCTCRQFQVESNCIHVAGLLIAWARERSTFVEVDEDSTENFDDDDLEDEEFLFDGLDDIFSGSAINEVMSYAGQGYPGNQPYMGYSPALSSRSRSTLEPAQDYRRLLSGLPLAELREIARLRNIPISGLRKDPILDQMAEALSQPGKLAEDWPLLSKEARQVAALIPFAPAPLQDRTLKPFAKTWGIQSEKAVESALEELMRFGLLVKTPYEGLDFPARLPFWLPPDPDFLNLSDRDPGELRIQMAPAPRALFQTILRLLVLLSSPGQTYRARSYEREERLFKKVPFLRGWPLDLDQFDSLVHGNSPLTQIRQKGVSVVSQPSLLDDDAQHRLSKSIGLDEGQFEWLLCLLSTDNKLLGKPGKPVSVADQALLSFVQAGAFEISKHLLVFSVSLLNWSELDLLLADPKNYRFVLHDHTGWPYQRLVENLATLRQNTLLLLRTLPGGHWYDLDGLVEKLSLLPLSTLLAAIDRSGNFFIKGRDIRFNDPKDLKIFLQSWLQAFFSGPLYWLGMVNLGWDHDRLVSFHWSEFGAALLGHRREYQMSEPLGGHPAIQFRPDGGLAVNLETIHGDILGLLSLLGQVETGQQGEIVYRPTLLGAGRAFEAGWTCERMIHTLEEAARTAVPENLAGKLNQWWTNFGSAQLYQNVALMEFGDDYALNELLAGTSLSHYLLYRFNSRLVAILPEGVDILREELVKKGYTPNIKPSSV